MPGRGDARIVILDIDEKSHGELGRWPWSRNVVAKLVDMLFDEYGVAVLAFDIVWAERDNSSGMEVLDTLAKSELKDAGGFQSAYRRLRGGLDYDGLLAASIKGRPVVLGHYFSSEESAIRANAIPAPVLPKGSFKAQDAPVTHWVGYTGNLPDYLANAAGAGFLNPITDVDGVVRRVPILAELDGDYHEAFALAVARAWLAAESADRRQPPVEPRFESAVGYARLESIAVGPLAFRSMRMPPRWFLTRARASASTISRLPMCSRGA